MQVHFRENVESVREEIFKREKALAERKEKLFQNKDVASWDLAEPVSNPADLLRDKGSTLPLILPKETQALQDAKDLFFVIATAFKQQALRQSSLALGEIGHHMAFVAADPLMQGHHS